MCSKRTAGDLTGQVFISPPPQQVSIQSVRAGSGKGGGWGDMGSMLAMMATMASSLRIERDGRLESNRSQCPSGALRSHGRFEVFDASPPKHLRRSLESMHVSH